jgi:hypothetical protein
MSAKAHAGALQQFFRHVDRTGEHERRLGADIGEGLDAAARGLPRPIALPPSFEPSSTPAAPSTMPEELPAWWTWLISSISGWALHCHRIEAAHLAGHLRRTG